MQRVAARTYAEVLFRVSPEKNFGISNLVVVKLLRAFGIAENEGLGSFRRVGQRRGTRYDAV